MRVLGVLHTADKPGVIRDTIRGLTLELSDPVGPRSGEVEFVEAHVKELMLSRGSVRLGVEGERESYPKPSNPFERFKNQVQALTGKYPGLTVHPLEVKGKAGLVARVSSYLSDREALKAQGRYAGELSPGAKMVVEEAERIPGYSVDKLITALDAYRSALMLDEGRRENDDLIVMGGTHAQHVEGLGGGGQKILHSPLSLARVTERTTGEQLRLYAEYKPAIDRGLEKFLREYGEPRA